MVKDPYKSFRERLELNYGNDPDIMEGLTQPILKNLMQKDGFRIRKSKIDGSFYKAFPSDEQVRVAWGILRGVGKIQTIIDVYLKEIYGNRTTYRANKNQIIDGKIYRKGQFVPKPKR